ncbi:MAG: hypothetical protein QNJ46_10105 [Leptolyngbyaceae cyanobacterium MO_188.B28]|nr:hypothetical protein [Leptolyngbyaceae cyanobacterium MO_188.B28]
MTQIPGSNLKRDNPVEKEYRIQNTEVSQELDSVSCLLCSCPVRMSRLKLHAQVLQVGDRIILAQEFIPMRAWLQPL